MLWDGMVEMPGSVAASDVLSTIRPYADQCCWDVRLRGCLVMLRASDEMPWLAVLTGPSRESRYGAFSLRTGGLGLLVWASKFVIVFLWFLRFLLRFYYYQSLLLLLLSFLEIIIIIIIIVTVHCVRV